MDRFRPLLWLAAVALFLPRSASSSEGTRYALAPQSAIVQVCQECTVPAGRPEQLSGSFSLTPLPLSRDARVEALTDVQWQSASYQVTGSGVVQFTAAGQLQIEVRARINGEDIRLRATRRQPNGSGDFTVVLATPRSAPVGYLLIVRALPQPEAPDADGDGVADTGDNCFRQANAEQADADGDGVGDACDECPETPAGAIVGGEGCGVEQACPCEGPRQGGEWQKGAYGRCAAQAIREMRQAGALTRREAIDLLRRMLHSGCGQTILASL